MLYLKTLGGLWLAGPQGPLPGSDAQRRRLALLALVAEAGEKGISRDRVVGMLWAESDEERARHSLNQTIYAFRRDLGADLVVGTRDLRVDPASLNSDISEFRSALGRGDLNFADELYQGPFLDGVYLDGAGEEFETWVERTRPRLSQALCGGLERAAQDRAQVGDWNSAVRLWRRIVSLDPLSGPRTLGLANALVSAGDRTGALQVLDRHQELIRTNLGATADGTVRSLAEQLRARVSTTAIRSSDSGPAPVVPPVAPVASIAPPAPLAAAPSAPISSGSSRWMKRRSTRLAAGGLLVAVAAAGLYGFWPRPLDDKHSILIAEFKNTTGDSVLDAGLAFAFAAALKQSLQVRVLGATELQATLGRMGRRRDTVIDEPLGLELAQREGIEVVVAGSVSAVDSLYDLVVRCIDPATGRELRIRRERSVGRASLLPALDRLARGLRRDLGESMRTVGEAQPLPSVTTSSLEALRLFADGNRAAAGEHLAEAGTFWQRAVALDSGFALAHAALGGLAYRNNQRPAGDIHFAKALAQADRLEGDERLLLEARIASWRRDWAGAIAGRLAYLQRHPGARDVRTSLGYNYMMAHLPQEALAAYDTASRTGPLDQADYINIGQVYKQLERWDSAYAAYQKAFTLAPELETTFYHNHEFGTMAVRLGRFDEARAIFSKMLPRTPNDRARGLRSLAYLDLQEGHYDAAQRKLSEAAFISQNERQVTSEARNRLLLADALQDQGETRAAGTQLGLVYAIYRAAYLEPRVLLWSGKMLARRGNVKQAAILLDSLRARAGATNNNDQVDLLQLSAELALAREQAGAAVQILEQAAARDSSTYVRESLAFALERAGQLDAAAQHYEVLANAKTFGYEGQQYERFASYRLGQLEERRGNVAAAARWYNRFVQQWPTADSTLPSLKDARERLVELSRRIE